MNPVVSPPEVGILVFCIGWATITPIDSVYSSPMMPLSHARPQTLSGALDARELYGLRPLCPQLRDCLTDHEPKFITSHRTVSTGMKKLSAYVVYCVESCKQTYEKSG